MLIYSDSYTEAIPLLYSRNTFQFPELEDFLIFSRFVVPHRLQAIRKLVFANHNDARKPWTSVAARRLHPALDCTSRGSAQLSKIFATMSSLREVTLVVYVRVTETGPGPGPSATTYATQKNIDWQMFEEAERYRATDCRFFGYIVYEVHRVAGMRTEDGVLLEGRWRTGELLRLR